MGRMKETITGQFDSRSFPDRPGHVFGSETSKDAAKKVDGSASAKREIIFNLILAAVDGMTCDDVEVALDMRHQTASARVRELVLAGRISDTGRTRKTRSGSGARVYEAI